VDKVTLYQSLASWETIVQDKLSVGQLANVVPGALKTYDLPDLAAMLAPRPLDILDPTRADGTVGDTEWAAAIYQPVLEAYRQAQASGAFRLVAPKRKD
jgi:hypothetical protein